MLHHASWPMTIWEAWKLAEIAPLKKDFTVLEFIWNCFNISRFQFTQTWWKMNFPFLHKNWFSTPGTKTWMVFLGYVLSERKNKRNTHITTKLERRLPRTSNFVFITFHRLLNKFRCMRMKLISLKLNSFSNSSIFLSLYVPRTRQRCTQY